VLASLASALDGLRVAFAGAGRGVTPAVLEHLEGAVLRAVTAKTTKARLVALQWAITPGLFPALPARNVSSSQTLTQEQGGCASSSGGSGQLALAILSRLADDPAQGVRARVAQEFRRMARALAVEFEDSSESTTTIMFADQPTPTGKPWECLLELVAFVARPSTRLMPVPLAADMHPEAVRHLLYVLAVGLSSWALELSCLAPSDKEDYKRQAKSSGRAPALWLLDVPLLGARRWLSVIGKGDSESEVEIDLSRISPYSSGGVSSGDLSICLQRVADLAVQLSAVKDATAATRCSFVPPLVAGLCVFAALGSRRCVALPQGMERALGKTESCLRAVLVDNESLLSARELAAVGLAVLSNANANANANPNASESESENLAKGHEGQEREGEMWRADPRTLTSFPKQLCSAILVLGAHAELGIWTCTGHHVLLWDYLQVALEQAAATVTVPAVGVDAGTGVDCAATALRVLCNVCAVHAQAPALSPSKPLGVLDITALTRVVTVMDTLPTRAPYRTLRMQALSMVLCAGGSRDKSMTGPPARLQRTGCSRADVVEAFAAAECYLRNVLYVAGVASGNTSAGARRDASGVEDVLVLLERDCATVKSLFSHTQTYRSADGGAVSRDSSSSKCYSPLQLACLGVVLARHANLVERGSQGHQDSRRTETPSNGVRQRICAALVDLLVATEQLPSDVEDDGVTPRTSTPPSASSSSSSSSSTAELQLLLQDICCFGLGHCFGRADDETAAQVGDEVVLLLSRNRSGSSWPGSGPSMDTNGNDVDVPQDSGVPGSEGTDLLAQAVAHDALGMLHGALAATNINAPLPTNRRGPVGAGASSVAGFGVHVSVCMLARRVGYPGLVLTALSLLRRHPTFGKGPDEEPCLRVYAPPPPPPVPASTMRSLVPRLYVATFDPVPNIRTTMRALWRVLILKDSSVNTMPLGGSDGAASTSTNSRNNDSNSTSGRSNGSTPHRNDNMNGTRGSESSGGSSELNDIDPHVVIPAHDSAGWYHPETQKPRSAIRTPTLNLPQS